MKKLVLISLVTLPLCGCVTGKNVASALAQLKNDPASVDATIVTPWGSAQFHRSFPTNWTPPAK